MFCRSSAMTFRLLVLFLSATALCLTVQAADPVGTEAEQLQASLAKWEKARDACGGNYSYSVRWSSAFGFGSVTTVTVQENQVVERKFKEFGEPKPVKPGEVAVEEKPTWVETGKDLGSHPGGTAAITVDAMYSEAKKILDTPLAEGEKRYLKFSEAGLLNYCFVVDTRIADDSPRKGVSPFELQLAKKP